MASLISGGEILNLHIGSTGINTAAAYWQILANEHDIVVSQQINAVNRALNKKIHTDLLNDLNKPLKKFTKKELQQLVRELNTYDSRLNTDAITKQVLNCTSSSSSGTQIYVPFQNLSPFFHEIYHRFIPRALLIDCDPSANYHGIVIPNSPLRNLFHNENYVFDNYTSRGNRSIAIDQSRNLLNNCINSIRAELEKCDNTQGYQITHHLGGGAGSGITSLLLHILHDEFYEKNSINSMTIMPSVLDISSRHHALEIYNSILSIEDLIENCALSFLFDNEALYDVCHKLVDIENPKWYDLNHLLGTYMSNLSCCMRFPDTHSYSRLYHTELIHRMQSNYLFPFVIPSFTPLTSHASNYIIPNKDDILDTEEQHDTSPLVVNNKITTKRTLKYPFNQSGTRTPTVSELIRTIYYPSNAYLSVDTAGHIYETALTIFRGQMTPEDILQEVYYDNHNKKLYHQWKTCMPDVFNGKICQQPMSNLTLSATSLGISTAIISLVEFLANRFDTLYSRNKAFTHTYFENNLEPQEFTHAREYLNYIIDDCVNYFKLKTIDRSKKISYNRQLGNIPFKTSPNEELNYYYLREIECKFI